MQRAPLPENEISRLDELHHLQILDTPSEEGFDNLARLASYICGTPIALVSLIDADRQWFKATVGIDAQETPRDIAFCAHAIHGRDLFIVQDTAQDPRFADNPLVTADPHIRFYAGMPLVMSSGHAMGTLCVIDRTPKQLTAEQLDALRMLGQQVISRLELRKRQSELEQNYAQLKESEQAKADVIRAIDYGLEGVAFLNKDGCFTSMSKTHAAIYGYQPEELIGRSWKTLYTQTVIDQIEQYYVPSFSHLSHWTCEVQARSKSGQTVFTEISLVRSEGTQHPNRWLICTCRNITDRLAAQRRLYENQKSLAQAQALAHVGSWEWDIVTGAETWSDEQFRVFGYAPQAITPTIETFRKAIHPDDRANVFKAIEAALEQNTSYEVTCRIIRPSGECRDLLCRGTVTRNLESRPVLMTGTVQDITERKLLEQMMSETIQRLDLATRSGGIGIWDYHIPENKLVWDKRMYELYSYSAEEFPATIESWVNRLHPEDRGATQALVQDAIEGRGQFDTEFRLLLPNQVIRHIKASALVLKDERGQPVRMHGINYDISSLKESQRALEEREASLEKFKSTLDQTLDCVFMFDPKTLRFTYCNRGACENVGYSEAELLRMTPLDLKPEFTEASYRALLNSLREGPDHLRVFQTVHRNKRGHAVPVEVTLQFVHQPGRDPHFVNIVRDITSRKQAEEQFRLVVEASPTGMLVVNENGLITLVNSQTERLFGYDRLDLVGQPVETLIPERLKDQHIGQRTAFFHDPHARAMGAGRDLFGRRKDGSEFPIEIALSPIKTAEGLQILGAIVDITTRKQAEEKLKQVADELAWKNTQLWEANESALSATRAKSEFLATMSHEIRTPMNAIIGMAELLQETPLSPDQANYVGRFGRAASSLMDLINAILDLSKIEAGHMTLESVPFDLHQLADTIAELMVGKALARRLEILVFVHPDVPQWVFGDPTRMHQVLVNLLGNAIKFTEAGHVMIKIEPAGDGSTAHALRFSISDTGIGIPSDKLQTIFEPFTQVDSTTTRKYGGTGLGLDISRRLVELMGGQLKVESTLGVGTTFFFVVQLPEAPPVLTKHNRQDITLHARRILVVDDNDTNLMIIRQHLSRSGVHLSEASSAAAALQFLDDASRRGEPFDLAILDYHMPITDGLALAAAIRDRQDCATLPLIMHASDLQGDATQRAKSLGIKSHLYKPLSRRRLMDSLAIALDQAPPEPARPEPEAMPERSALPFCRILLVEDVEDNRDVVALFLKDTGYQIDMAENGAVAFKKFQTGLYDLVLMDMQMPVLDGLQATAAIRQWEHEQQRPPTPIVALTANAFKEETDKSLAAGCTSHITKPIKKKTLLSTIIQHVSASKDQAA